MTGKSSHRVDTYVREGIGGGSWENLTVNSTSNAAL